MKLLKTTYNNRKGKNVDNTFYVMDREEREDFGDAVARFIIEVQDSGYKGLNNLDMDAMYFLKKMTIGMWKNYSQGLDLAKDQLIPVNKLISKIKPGYNFFSLFFPRLDINKLEVLNPTQMKRIMDIRRSDIEYLHKIITDRNLWLPEGI